MGPGGALGQGIAIPVPIAQGGTNNTVAYGSGGVNFSDGVKVTVDATNFIWDNTNKRLGVGPQPPSFALHVQKTETDATAGTKAMGRIQIVLLASANSPATYAGVWYGAQTSASSTVNYSGALTGSFYESYHRGSGTLGALRAVSTNIFQVAGAGVVSSLIGLNLNMGIEGTVTNILGVTFNASIGAAGVAALVSGFDVTALNVTAGGAVTAAYGFRSVNIGKSGITGAAGIAIDAISAATNNVCALLGTLTIPAGNWGLYNASANDNLLTGKTGHGLAPAGNGKLQAQAGTSAVNAKAGGAVYASATAVNNSGTGETTLWSQTIAAAVLGVDGDTLHFYYAGTIQTSANNKRLRVKFGATTFFDSTAQNPGVATAFVIHGRIVRTGATTQKCSAELATTVGTLFTFTGYAAAAETLANAIALAITGQGGASNEITFEYGKVWWESAP